MPLSSTTWILFDRLWHSVSFLPSLCEPNEEAICEKQRGNATQMHELPDDA